MHYRDVVFQGLRESGSLHILRRDFGASYLYVAVIVCLLAQLMQAIIPFSPLVKGQNLAVVLGLISIPIMCLLAWRSSTRIRWSKSVFGFLALLVGTWATLTIFSVTRSGAVNYATALLPLLIVLLLLRPVSREQARRAAYIFAWGLIAIILVYGLSARIDLVDPRNEFPHRYLGIIQFLHLEWRWEGPFGNVNYSGPIGAYLVILGLFSRGKSRILLILSGVLALLASEARGAFIAALVGTAIWVVSRTRISKKPRFLALATVCATVGVGMIFLSLLLRDPTLNGRTGAWIEYLQMWRTNPVWGVGQVGIDSAIQEGTLVSFATQGHNLFIHILTLYGLAGLTLVVAVLVSALAITVSAIRRQEWIGFALFATFVVCNFTEVLTTFAYSSIQLFPLILSVLLVADRVTSQIGRSMSEPHPDSEMREGTLGINR